MFHLTPLTQKQFGDEAEARACAYMDHLDRAMLSDAKLAELAREYQLDVCTPFWRSMKRTGAGPFRYATAHLRAIATEATGSSCLIRG